MDYKKMMGYGDKKKVTKKESKPKVNKILEGIKGDLNEWDSFKKTPNRWSKKFGGDGLTEYERGKVYTDKDKPPFKVNEGPAADYAKAYTNVKKTYGAFWDSVHDFESLLKSKGLGRHAKEVNKQYKNTVEKFFKFFFKMMDKLQ